MNPNSPEGERKTSGRIVLIEDDDSIRQVLRFQLEAAGYEVSTAADGQAGLDMVRANPPDLVITDLMMPVMDGHEVCREIKSHFGTSHVPVIMLTAKSDMPARVKALDYGANDYLVKPYEQQEMLLRVRNLLNWSRAQRDANPLTGLPGNVVIEREVAQRLAEGRPFVFLYIDIDNFKAYNDNYGYVQGDGAIRFLARLLVDTAAQFGRPDDFVGHVGGDDFVVITAPEALTAVTSRLIERFDAEVATLFSPEHRRAGFIRVLNRRGEMEQFSLMSLTIAAVPSSKYAITHLAQLNDLASELKKYGKSIKGSVLVCERRGEGHATGANGAAAVGTAGRDGEAPDRTGTDG